MRLPRLGTKAVTLSAVCAVSNAGEPKEKSGHFSRLMSRPTGLEAEALKAWYTCTPRVKREFHGNPNPANDD